MCSSDTASPGRSVSKCFYRTPLKTLLDHRLLYFLLYQPKIVLPMQCKTPVLCGGSCWWRWADLNRRHHDYESCALTS